MSFGEHITLEKKPDGGVIYKSSDSAGEADIIAASREIYSGEDEIRAIKYKLVDLTEVTKQRLSPAALMTLASLDERAMAVNPSMLIAIVAPAMSVFGTSRQHLAYFHGDESNIHLFHSMGEATEWIKCMLGQSEG